MSALPWDSPPCTCPAVDEEFWTRYGDAVEPGSTTEWDPACPEHGVAGSPPPASTPDARTVYCAECGGPSDVVDESTEHEDYLGQHVRTLWVRRLDCGHDEVTER